MMKTLKIVVLLLLVLVVAVVIGFTLAGGAMIKGAVTSMSLTIDGVLVMSDANKDEFYVSCTPFDPIIEYAEPTSYDSVAAIAFQGVGFVSPPLPPGLHVIHLYERYAIEGWFGVIYDNTWHVLVKP